MSQKRAGANKQALRSPGTRQDLESWHRQPAVLMPPHPTSPSGAAGKLALQVQLLLCIEGSGALRVATRAHQCRDCPGLIAGLGRGGGTHSPCSLCLLFPAPGGGPLQGGAGTGNGVPLRLAHASWSGIERPQSPACTHPGRAGGGGRHWPQEGRGQGSQFDPAHGWGAFRRVGAAPDRLPLKGSRVVSSWALL